MGLKRNSVPLRVDPAFYYFVKEAVGRDPSLNVRKVTNNMAKKKCIIGDLLFNDRFSSDIEKIINMQPSQYDEVMRSVDEMFKKKRFYP